MLNAMGVRREAGRTPVAVMKDVGVLFFLDCNFEILSFFFFLTAK
jgi:hypothetical protein